MSMTPSLLMKTRTVDSDGDGIGDNLDEDDDQDTWSDTEESLCGSNPLDNSDTPVDFDGDKICDVMDEDRDGDQVPNAADDCEGHDDRLDADGDGIPDGCDSDMDLDGDGLNNVDDQCDSTPSHLLSQIDENGCAPSEYADSDFDGIHDGLDICPDTPLDESPNQSGCGASQRDTDGDGCRDKDEQIAGTDWTDASDVEDSCIQSNSGTKGDDSMSLSTWAIIIGILIAVIIAALVIAVRWKLNEDDEARPSKNKVDSKKKVEKKELTADDIFAELDDDDFAELLTMMWTIGMMIHPHSMTMTVG